LHHSRSTSPHEAPGNTVTPALYFHLVFDLYYNCTTNLIWVWNFVCNSKRRT
jgi:hypothetical protein